MPTRSAVGIARPCHLLTDPQGRTLDYLRLAVTERCNLRCLYCMPEAGIASAPEADLLTLDEAERLCRLFHGLGVRRIRLTGGEPLVRPGVVAFVQRLAAIDQELEILLTTNGVLLADHLDGLQAAGIRRINLSLDSLDSATWSRITRRRGFASVRRGIDAVLERGLGLKINVVVLAGVNDHEVPDFVELARRLPVAVRFIESMSFDGRGGQPGNLVAGRDIAARLRDLGAFEPGEARREGVALMSRQPGFLGSVGVIEGHSRSFCGACTRLRLDARGRLRTCLYGQPQLDLRALIRRGCRDDELHDGIREVLANRAEDGHVAERRLVATALDSMASIGG